MKLKIKPYKFDREEFYKCLHDQNVINEWKDLQNIIDKMFQQEINEKTFSYMEEDRKLVEKYFTHTSKQLRKMQLINDSNVAHGKILALEKAIEEMQQQLKKYRNEEKRLNTIIKMDFGE